MHVRARQRGFTLLEVMIALAILGMSLMAIFQLNSQAVAMHAYTKRLTVASMLARAKMIDIEQELYDEGFQIDDQELSGGFEEEGWEMFKWRARIIFGQRNPDAWFDGSHPERMLRCRPRKHCTPSTS